MRQRPRGRSTSDAKPSRSLSGDFPQLHVPRPPTHPDGGGGGGGGNCVAQDDGRLANLVASRPRRRVGSASAADLSPSPPPSQHRRDSQLQQPPPPPQHQEPRSAPTSATSFLGDSPVRNFRVRSFRRSTSPLRASPLSARRHTLGSGAGAPVVSGATDAESEGSETEGSAWMPSLGGEEGSWLERSDSDIFFVAGVPRVQSMRRAGPDPDSPAHEDQEPDIPFGAFPDAGGGSGGGSGSRRGSTRLLPHPQRPPAERHSSFVLHRRNSTVELQAVRERRRSILQLRDTERRQSLAEKEGYRDERRKASGEWQGSPGGSARLLAEEQEHRVCVWEKVVRTVRGAAIIGHIVERAAARKRMAVLLMPCVLRWIYARRARLKRTERLQARLPHMTRPSVDTLRRVAFFNEWPEPALRAVAEGMEPVVYASGEFICMEGDVGGDMYMVSAGTLEVLVRKGCAGKSRARGTRIATITAASAQNYFGEFSVLYREVRFATVRAVTDVELWSAPSTAVRQALQSLDGPARSKVDLLCAARRQANLATLYPLRASCLAASSAVMASFAPARVHELVPLFRPLSVHASTPLYQEGDGAESVYYVASGVVELTRSAKRGGAGAGGGRKTRAGPGGYSSSADEVPVRRIPAGRAFGAAELLFLEPRGHTAATRGAADLWVLGKADLLRMLMSHPAAFIAAKAAATAARSKTEAVPPADAVGALAACPTVARHVPSRLLQKVAASVLAPHTPEEQGTVGGGGGNSVGAGRLARPLVLGRGDSLRGEFEGLLLVAAGCLRSLQDGSLHRAGAVLCAGELLTFQRSFDGFVAEARCDLWVVSQVRLLRTLRESHLTAFAALCAGDAQARLAAAHGLKAATEADRAALLAPAVVASASAATAPGGLHPSTLARSQQPPSQQTTPRPRRESSRRGSRLLPTAGAPQQQQFRRGMALTPALSESMVSTEARSTITCGPNDDELRVASPAQV